MGYSSVYICNVGLQIYEFELKYGIFYPCKLHTDGISCICNR